MGVATDKMGTAYCRLPSSDGPRAKCAQQMTGREIRIERSGEESAATEAIFAKYYIANMRRPLDQLCWISKT